MQVIPSEVLLHPGDKAGFRVRKLDANGLFVENVSDPKSLTWNTFIPPTALVKALSPDTMDLFDPLFTAVLVIRWPIFKTNFAIVGTLSTNGQVGLGISLLNTSLIPVLP